MATGKPVKSLTRFHPWQPPQQLFQIDLPQRRLIRATGPALAPMQPGRKRQSTLSREPLNRGGVRAEGPADHVGPLSTLQSLSDLPKLGTR